MTFTNPFSLGNSCCTFGFLIFIIIERNFLYNSLYILTEILKASLHHQSLGLRAFLSLSFSLPLSYHRLWTTRFRSIKGPKVASEQGLWYTWHFRQRDSGTIEVISTKTRVKWLESPVFSLLYFTICLKLRDFWFHANE